MCLQGFNIFETTFYCPYWQSWWKYQLWNSLLSTITETYLFRQTEVSSAMLENAHTLYDYHKTNYIPRKHQFCSLRRPYLFAHLHKKSDRRWLIFATFCFFCSPFASLPSRFLSSPTSFSYHATSLTSPSSTIDLSSSVSACLFRRSWPSTGFRTTHANSSSPFPSTTRSSRCHKLDCTFHNASSRMPVNAACLISATCWQDWGVEYCYRRM